MPVYTDGYKFLDEGIYGEAIDFPGVTTCGQNAGGTRRLLAASLADLAETSILVEKPLPRPNAEMRDPGVSTP